MGFREVLSHAYGLDSRPLITEVHPKDEMMVNCLRQHDHDPTKALQQYLGVGHVSFSVLNQILRWMSRSWRDSMAVLDFASGFGRVSRFLLQVLPPERIWVSEIQEHAVPFQVETFGFHGIQSHTDPEDVDLSRGFDLISVVSLFTHLPEPTFKTWMEKLGDALSEGGIMMLTTHGPGYFEEQYGRPLDRPFFFADRSESDALDPESYGTTYCHPSYVEDLVRTIPGLDVIGQVTEAMGAQDVFVIGRNCPRPTTALEVRENPIGGIDDLLVEPGGSVRIRGWALDRTDLQPVKRVSVLADGVLLGDATLLQERPRLSKVFGSHASQQGGWSITVPIPEHWPGWLCIVPEDRHGLTAVRCRPAEEMVANLQQGERPSEP